MAALQWDADEPYIQVTETVRHTPFRPTDADAAAWASLNNEDAVAAAAKKDERPYTVEQGRAFISQKLADARPVIERLRAGRPVGGCPLDVLRLHPSGELIGTLNVHLSDKPVPPSSGPDGAAADADPGLPWLTETWDLGYKLSLPYTGRGLMTAAVRAFIDGYLRPVMRLRQLSAGSRANNAASHAVLRKAGFVHVFDYERVDPPHPTLLGAKFHCVFPADE
ncbi:hypothetical protein Q5752_007085 [Cryptotrichosporon argae]